MQRGLNEVNLIGNLASAPDIKNFGEGDKAGKVATLTVVTNSFWTDKEGNKQEKPEFHRVVCFGAPANFADQYLVKGQQVLVKGMLTTRKYTDKEGQERYTTEVVVNPMESGMLQGLHRPASAEGNTPAAQQQAPAQQAPQQAAPSPQQAPAQQAPQAPEPPMDDGDDDIPF